MPSPWEAAPAIDGPISRQEAPWLAAPPIDDQPAKPPITGTIEWNGKKAEVTVPGDATDDQIKAAGRAALVAKYPKVKFPEAKTIWLNDQRDHMSPERTLGDYAGIGGRAVARSFGSMADMVGIGTPSILLTPAFGPLAPVAGGIYNHATGKSLGRDMADTGSDKLGLAAPSTDNERLGSAAAEGATTALLGGGPVSVARPALMAGSGASSGVASEATRQAGGGPLAQMAAGLIGGVAPIATPAAVRAAVGGVASRSVVAPAAPRAAVELQQAAYDPAKALANVKARPAPSPESAPTLAEVAKDPGLAAFQRSKRSTALKEQQQRNAIARADTVDHTGGRGNPGVVQGMARAQADDAAQAVTASREAIGPQMDRADSGAQVRGQFDAAHNNARAQTSAAYNDPALVAEPKPVEFTNQFHDDLGTATKPFYGDGSAPMSPELAAIVDDLRKPGATSERFGNIDSRLADFSANIRRQGGSNTEAAAADRLRGVIDAHASKILPAEQVAALQAAKQARAAQGQTFEQGNAAEAFGTKRYGEPVRDNVELPPALVKPGPVGAATVDRLELAIGRDATEATVRAELRRIADGGEVTKPAQVQALVKKYGETLSRFPGLSGDLKRLHDRAALNETFLKSPLGKMVEGDPATAIGKVVFGDDAALAAQLVNQVKASPSALAGLRRSFAELINRAGKGNEVTANGRNISDPAKTAQAIDMVLARSGKTFTSQQRVVLRQVRTELNRVLYAEKAGVVKGKEVEINPLDAASTFSTKASVLNRVFGWASNQKRVDALIEKALLDPAFATELLAKPTPARLNRFKSTLGAAATGAALGAQGDEQ